MCNGFVHNSTHQRGHAEELCQKVRGGGCDACDKRSSGDLEHERVMMAMVNSQLPCILRVILLKTFANRLILTKRCIPG